ncbi:hypothetical protein FRC14_000523 [Serendipita sp. 396]|nr:hypothetical protein FRC14_000523 [Serendipita sp. 396]
MTSFAAVFVPLVIISVITAVIAFCFIPDNWLGERVRQVGDIAARIHEEEQQQQQQEETRRDEALLTKIPKLYHCFVSQDPWYIPPFERKGRGGCDQQWRTAMPLNVQGSSNKTESTCDTVIVGFLVQMPTQKHEHTSSHMVETTLELATIDLAETFGVTGPKNSVHLNRR